MRGSLRRTARGGDGGGGEEPQVVSHIWRLSPSSSSSTCLDTDARTEDCQTEARRHCRQMLHVMFMQMASYCCTQMGLSFIPIGTQQQEQQQGACHCKDMCDALLAKVTEERGGSKLAVLPGMIYAEELQSCARALATTCSMCCGVTLSR